MLTYLHEICCSITIIRITIKHMHTYICYIIGNALDIQGPDHILGNDQFKVSCRGSQAVQMKVHNCPVKYGLPRKNNGEFYLNASITHVKKPCKIQCFSGTLIETKEILVIGKIKP